MTPTAASPRMASSSVILRMVGFLTATQGCILGDVDRRNAGPAPYRQAWNCSSLKKLELIRPDPDGRRGARGRGVGSALAARRGTPVAPSPDPDRGPRPWAHREFLVGWAS